MQKPVKNYNYYPWSVGDYNSWARQAQEQGEWMLCDEYHRFLQELYEKEMYTEEQHKQNLEKLGEIQMDLCNVWSYKVRSKAGMEHLESDYKKYYGLEEI